MNRMQQMERMLTAAGFRDRNLCIEAWSATFVIQRTQSLGSRPLLAAPAACSQRLNGSSDIDLSHCAATL